MLVTDPATFKRSPVTLKPPAVSLKRDNSFISVARGTFHLSMGRGKLARKKHIIFWLSASNHHRRCGISPTAASSSSSASLRNRRRTSDSATALLRLDIDARPCLSFELSSKLSHSFFQLALRPSPAAAPCNSPSFSVPSRVASLRSAASTPSTQQIHMENPPPQLIQ
ncbi:hypothetical protein CC80DRAFT_311298 [Byssothecium circinans]|uniref:Uncharacterized protein n=1 Tax=Byssothecium circinans TaxID=147558 RepID=A0A6A5U672_9PLEO|nr:hypothetical protein CC80DRAFT_311298 [Byssothecium circinans]